MRSTSLSVWVSIAVMTLATGAYPAHWLRLANRLLPPNVFHLEHEGLRAKYAVLSEGDFAALNRADASTVSVWRSASAAPA